MILVVCALQEEFVSNDYNILYTGIGKVSATYNLTKTLLTNKNIKLVVNYGTAGSINTKKNNIIECGNFYISNFFDKNKIQCISTKKDLNKVYCVDTFCTDKNKFKDYDCVDMESYALAYVCNQFGIKFKCFKYISDNLGEKDQHISWKQNINKGSDLFIDILKKL